MKKLVVYLGVVVFLLIATEKQLEAQIVDGAFKRNDIIEKKPMPLPSVREADVFFFFIIWRIIDLREKMNLPLYYPTIEMDGRKNLISLLLEGIEKKLIKAYNADGDFSVNMDTMDIMKVRLFLQDTVSKRNLNTGEMELEYGDLKTIEVKQYLLKEEWYFDKQNSTLNVRIIGICPMLKNDRQGSAPGQVEYEKMFWIPYDEATRQILSTNLILNPYNSAQQVSFDDLFIKRAFSSYVIAGENVYNNRPITSILKGKEATRESKRIEDEIFNYEQDLWEY